MLTGIIAPGPLFLFDWICSDTPLNKARCVAWSKDVNADPDWGVNRFADPRMANCDPSEVTTYYNPLQVGVGRRMLKRLWDPRRRISYWMDADGTNQMCDAGVVQAELSSTCLTAGVDADSLAALKYNEYKDRCGGSAMGGSGFGLFDVKPPIPCLQARV